MTEMHDHRQAAERREAAARVRGRADQLVDQMQELLVQLREVLDRERADRAGRGNVGA